MSKLPKHKQYQPLDKTWLKMLYWDYKWTAVQISEHLEVSSSWVTTEIVRLGLSKKKNGIKFRGKKGIRQSVREREVRQNQPHSKQVIRISLDGSELKQYRSIKYAAKSNGVKNPSHITRAIKEPFRTCGGYRWKLLEEI